MLLSFPVSNHAVPVMPSWNELKCMATNIYREARGEPTEGQIAVAKVVINRTKTKGYPKTMCGVIYQKNQFSWTNDYKDVKYTLNELDVAVKAINSEDGFKATHYHNKTVKPSWRKRLKEGVTIGNHIFYYD